TLAAAGVRVEVDAREGYTPAWKFNDWELKGVPLRLEYGPRDAENKVVSTARRDTGEKATIAISELATEVPVLLEKIQKDLYDKADHEFESHRKVINKWEDVLPSLDAKNVVLIPHCLSEECEDK